MRIQLAIAIGAVAGLSALPALAQAPLYPGQDVSVNPAAAGGSQMLLYPGGTYARIVPQLKEPGTSSAPIKLHMPVKHHRKPKPVQTASENDTAAEAVDTAPPPEVVKQVKAAPPPTKTAKAEQPKQQPDTSASEDSYSGGDTAYLPLSLDGSPVPQTAPTRQQKQQKTAALSAPPPTEQTRTNAAKSVAAEATDSNLSRHGQIKFRHDATDIVPAAMSGIRMLASDLNSALDAGARRIQLDAYGGAAGDRSSEARRLSLKRALTIRQLLIDAGVPANRIDVRAMGGASDGGGLDRVDVYVRA